jgi:hypothetical protein
MVDTARRERGQAARALSGTARNRERVTERLEDLLELTRLVRRDRRARAAAGPAKSATAPR